MEQYGIKRMLFGSSEGFNEDNGRKMSIYGSAKIMIERILQETYCVDPTWSIKIIRYLRKQDYIYRTKEVDLLNMCRVYINEYETIEEARFQTYEIEIVDKAISTHKILEL